MKHLMLTVALACAAITVASAGEAEKSPAAPAAELLEQILPTIGSQPRVIVIPFPVSVAKQWRRYFVARFVQEYAATLERLISSEMEPALLADEPQDDIAEAWDARVIVVPDEFERLAEEDCPSPAALKAEPLIDSWRTQAPELARKHFAELKQTLRSAK